MNQTNYHIARRIRGKRRALGLSQEALAKELGVDPCLLDAYERARQPVPPGHLARLGEIMGVPLSYFLPAEHAPTA